MTSFRSHRLFSSFVVISHHLRLSKSSFIFIRNGFGARRKPLFDPRAAQRLPDADTALLGARQRVPAAGHVDPPRFLGGDSQIQTPRDARERTPRKAHEDHPRA